jgi:hypothetical protein
LEFENRGNNVADRKSKFDGFDRESIAEKLSWLYECFFRRGSYLTREYVLLVFPTRAVSEMFDLYVDGVQEQVRCLLDLEAFQVHFSCWLLTLGYLSSEYTAPTGKPSYLQPLRRTAQRTK